MSSEAEKGVAEQPPAAAEPAAAPLPRSDSQSTLEALQALETSLRPADGEAAAQEEQQFLSPPHSPPNSPPPSLPDPSGLSGYAALVSSAGKGDIGAAARASLLEAGVVASAPSAPPAPSLDFAPVYFLPPPPPPPENDNSLIVLSRMHDALLATRARHEQREAAWGEEARGFREALRRERTARAQLEAAAAIREAREAARAEEAREAAASASPDPAASLQAQLAEARAETEAAREDARSLAAKLASARRALLEPASPARSPAQPCAQPCSAEHPGADAGSDAAVRQELSAARAQHAAACDELRRCEAQHASMLAEVCAQLEAVLRENGALRAAAADGGGAGAAALASAHVELAEATAAREDLTARLEVALADCRAANTAAAGAHVRASLAAAVAASLRGGADDEDDEDCGITVPLAKARRLEAALRAAQRELGTLSERRAALASAASREFESQYELRREAEAMLLTRLAEREAALREATEQLMRLRLEREAEKEKAGAVAAAAAAGEADAQAPQEAEGVAEAALAEAPREVEAEAEPAASAAAQP